MSLFGRFSQKSLSGTNRPLAIFEGIKIFISLDGAFFNEVYYSVKELTQIKIVHVQIMLHQLDLNALLTRMSKIYFI